MGPGIPTHTDPPTDPSLHQFTGDPKINTVDLLPHGTSFYPTIATTMVS